MTTSEQQKPVENTSNFPQTPQTTIESRARAFREFRGRAAFFNDLLTNDSEKRANASDRITQLLKTWAKEYYPSETAGTATGDNNGIVSGVSSPYSSSNLVTPLSSLSPFNSPLFTDGSGSASVSSYAPSPNIPRLTSEEVVDTNISENLGGYVNQRELQRNGIPDGPPGDFSRRNSADENSSDVTEKSEEKKEHLRLLILAVLRMSIDCPFADVRCSFNRCLKRLRAMNVPVPAPINPSPSFYIAPEDIITLEWPSEYTNNSLTQCTPRSITPSGCSSSCSSSSSNSSSFSEELPRVIQQPLTPATPLYPASPPRLPIGRQPDDLVKKMLIDTFVRLGRLSHFYRILAYFPSFMERYQESYNIIVGGDRPVQLDWRLYIGIMAASQYKCQYVVSKLTNDFLVHGGNIDWLQGLQHAPTKIRNLSKLNTILAHQPWRLKPSHIGALVKGATNPQDNWTIPEIVHVIVILSTFHSLSSYVLGCGIVPEYDCNGGSCESLCTPSTPTEESGSSVGILDPNLSSEIASGMGITLQEQPQESSSTEKTTVETVKASEPIPIPKKPSLTLERSDVEVNHTSQLIKRLNLRNKEDDKLMNYGSVSSDGSYSHSNRISGFDNVDEDTFTDESDISSPFSFSQEFFSNVGTTPHTLAQPTYNPPPTEDFTRFLDPEVEMHYEDFVVNSSEYNVFKLQDYCWEDHGVVTVNSYLPGVGEVLDQEFSEIRDLTDYSLFHSYKSSSNIDLDTTPLRQAIWYYVQRLTGLLKEDYEYRDINTFLNKKIKAFLKKVCCTPHEIGYNDWRGVGFRLREEEKCHVNLIAVEARKQAELVHGLSCVMRWVKGRE